MKILLLFAALILQSEAALLAHFQTTQGTVTVDLQYTKTPQTVANFITLSQGTRTRLNAETGALTRKPFYVGEKFFRVLNEPTFKIAQTGSGNGTNVGGGPGYAFRDEFDASLTHVPYVLSMANSGPNSNGSQIFLTGNATLSHLNNVHTIFGIITDPASRSVIDAIHAAGSDATTITAVTISRTDPGAVAFDEFAQRLPVCGGLGGKLDVTLGTKTDYLFNSPQAAGSILQGYRSENLVSWEKLGQVYQGTGNTGYDSITLDDASLSKAFYNLSLVTYPDALAPASYANKTLTCGLFGSQTFTFHFDSTGQGGTAIYSNSPTQPTAITAVSYSASSPYAATWIIQTEAYNPFRFRCTLKSETTSLISGTNTSEQYSGQWNALSGGFMTLTR